MRNSLPFTIDQFYKFMEESRLMAAKCLKCGKMHLPPRPMCDSCYGQEFSWMEVSGKGRLMTYSIIYVAPPQFQVFVPYTIGIIQLESGLRLPGMIFGLSEEKLKVGVELSVDFESCSTGQVWPPWRRYCFRPT